MKKYILEYGNYIYLILFILSFAVFLVPGGLPEDFSFNETITDYGIPFFMSIFTLAFLNHVYRTEEVSKDLKNLLLQKSNAEVCQWEDLEPTFKRILKDAKELNVFATTPYDLFKDYGDSLRSIPKLSVYITGCSLELDDLEKEKIFEKLPKDDKEDYPKLIDELIKYIEVESNQIFKVYTLDFIPDVIYTWIRCGQSEHVFVTLNHHYNQEVEKVKKESRPCFYMHLDSKNSSKGFINSEMRFFRHERPLVYSNRDDGHDTVHILEELKKYF